MLSLCRLPEFEPAYEIFSRQVSIVDAQIDTSHLKLFLSSCIFDDSERVLSFYISIDLKMNDLCQTLCLKLSGNLLSIFSDLVN